jgi:hydrogenase maturation protease
MFNRKTLLFLARFFYLKIHTMKSELASALKGLSVINLDEDKSNKVLVLGVGNYLMGDEGVGVHVIYEMEEINRPDYVDVLDGGTGGFFLMNYFDEYPVVIFLDATMDGKPAGTVSTIRPKFAADFPTALSVHDVGLKDMIEAIYIQDSIPDIHLVTVSVPDIIPMTLELSKEVEASVPKAIAEILRLAKENRPKQKS